MEDVDQPMDAGSTYLRVGRRAWATLGIAGVLLLVGIVLGRLALVVVPVLLALFPAALLMPLAQLLKRVGLPDALAAIATILVLLAALAGVGAGVAQLVQAELPELEDSLGEGITELEQVIADDPLRLGYDFPGFSAALDAARERLLGAGEDGRAGGPMAAASAVTEGLTGVLLVLVVTFFYLKDEGRLAAGVIETLPRSWRRHAHELASRFWLTVGRYFRGQILVAAVDAVFIGIGLVLLGIPLALPLAVLVFFGALFPIVGSVVAGGVAVLVALADAGLLRAVAVLALIIVVQQIEGNVLEPLVQANAIDLNPLVIILVLTAGSVLLGVLGAFLAVPIAAGVARSLDYARSEMGPERRAGPDDPPSGPT